MSVTNAALRYRCDVPGCGCETFVVCGDAPAGWRRRLATSSEQTRTGADNPAISIDLCPQHADHLDPHSPLMPGTVHAELIGTVLILSHDLACTGCDWSIDQVIPVTASAGQRNELLAAAWLAHLNTPDGRASGPAMPTAAEAVCVVT